MVFKEPLNHFEAIRLEDRANDLVAAAKALDACKIEPDMSGRLRMIAKQMMDAILHVTQQEDEMMRTYGPRLGVVNDKAVVLAAQCIWDEITDEPWSQATPEQQRKYIKIARAALLAAGVALA